MMNQPNATVYVKNIDWKVKKPLLKRALYALFSRHGKVLEVIVLRRDGLRGQAWIIMQDVQAATAAIQAENGFTFFGRELGVEYAREKSDRIARFDGTYVPKAKRKKLQQQAQEQQQQQGLQAQEQNQQQDAQTGDATAAAEATTTPAAESAATTTESNPASSEEPKASATDGTGATALEDAAPPSKYLLAQDLPADCNEMMLGMLFRQHNGFKDVRMPRPGLAFIEYEDEPHATLALKALNGFKLTSTDHLKLTYGKA